MVQQGTADLQVTNGVITVSDGTGMFAGIFPTVQPGKLQRRSGRGSVHAR
jgi:hypothetical protein